jgi:hypothetical protein
MRRPKAGKGKLTAAAMRGAKVKAARRTLQNLLLEAVSRNLRRILRRILRRTLQTLLLEAVRRILRRILRTNKVSRCFSHYFIRLKNAHKNFGKQQFFFSFF